MNALIYDLEIVRAIPGKDPIPIDIECCEGWHDHANMGVSVVGVYDYLMDRYRVFLEDNIEEFFTLCAERDCLIGFNNIAFDNRVLHYAKPQGIVPPIAIEKCYDILREIFVAARLGPDFTDQHYGYSLDAVCKHNGLGEKSGHGALAPILWQQSSHGKVIDYCLNDIALTRQLTDLICREGYIVNPKNGSRLYIRQPNTSRLR